MLPAFNEKHSDRNTAVCLRHASQPNGDAQLLCDGWEKNTLDPFKNVLDFKTAGGGGGGVRCFLELSHLP